ncbi:MAG: alpha/beta hydrolase [Clostridiales bacterium]|nr:alpha/beta hydrolase [Clostridiales bacterium]
MNKAMRLALAALSYTDIDIKKNYKLRRSVAKIKAPLLTKPLYNFRDLKICSDGREIPVRIYTPKTPTNDRVLLFFHGGGWVTESVDTYNRVCLNLAKGTGCRVISVEYRLAPEHPFPAGLEDCYAVAREFICSPEGFDITPDKITLIGDSAGANLAAAVSLLARDRGEFSIHSQILIYPATYNDHTENSPFPSVVENGKGYLLTSKKVSDYMTLYMSSEEDKNSPYFAPLLAADFSKQPATLIITAQYDPLRDEGEAYGKRLANAGVKVRIYRAKEALHGYFSLEPIYPQVRKTYELINKFLYEVQSNDQSPGGRLEPS